MNRNLLKRATFFPENRSSVDMDPGPSLVMMPKEPEGMVSPTLMVIFLTWLLDRCIEMPDRKKRLVERERMVVMMLWWFLSYPNAKRQHRITARSGDLAILANAYVS